MKGLLKVVLVVACSAALVVALFAFWRGDLSLPLGSAVTDPASPAESSLPIEIPATATTATVNYVHDGDTLFLTTPADANLKVRLLAVDTPEIGDNLECLGPEATDYLRALLPEGSTVYTQSDVEPLDQYGRSLLFVWTSSGELVNLSLVSSGYAEAVFTGGNRMLEAQVEAAEDAARAAGLGIWGAC